MEKIKNFFKDESGVSAVEYALMASVVTIGLIVAVKYFYGQLSTALNSAGDQIVDPGE